MKMADPTKVKFLYAIGCLDGFAFSLIMPLLFDRLRVLGMTPVTIGALGSLHSGLQLISSPIIGSWSDIRGHRSIMQITLLVCSVSYLVLGAATTFALVLFSRIVQGLFEHMRTMCGTLLANVAPPEKLSEVQGRLASVGGISFIVGPIIGGHLAELDNGFQYVCYIVSLTLLLNFAIVFLFIPNSKDVKTTTSGSVQRSSSKRKSKSLRSEIFQAVTSLANIDWPLYWDIFAFKFFSDFTLGLHHHNFAIILKDIYDVKPIWLGYTMSVLGITGATTSFLMGRISKLYKNDKTHAKRAFHGCLLLTLSFALLSIAPSLSYIVLCLVLLSIAHSLLAITENEIILQRTAPDQRGSVIGSAQSIFSLAFLVSPICSGVVYEIYGFWGMSLLKIVTALIALSFTAFLFKRKIGSKKEE